MRTVMTTNCFNINSEWQVTVEYESDITICTASGNVNNDESIDVLDIVAIVNFIIGTSSFNSDQECEADINIDGNIDVLDLIHLVQIIIE